MKGAKTKSKVYKLMLYNDDIHTFEYVIDSLVKICGHSPEQAEQCAYLVHLKGHCDIKRGTFTEVREVCEAMYSSKLITVIED